MQATYTADNWQELTQAVADARVRLECRPEEELWFRGVSTSSYTLILSLFRAKHPDPRKLEYDLFFEFLAKARTGTGTTLSDWDVLFLMQHYRAPTRLLDWTEVLMVAVHFAVAYLKPDDARTPRIFVMNPYLWNAWHFGSNDPSGRDLVWPHYFGWDEKEQYYYDFGELLLEDDGIDWDTPVALYPPQRNERLSAQRGYFTIHGTDSRPLEAMAPKLIVAIDLTHSAVSEAKHQLEYSGANEYSLFPDLEGLSRYLRIKYEVD